MRQCVASVNCLELPADGHFAWDVRWQGLKPNLLQFVYGPTKQAAEKPVSLKGTAFRPYLTAV
jgi:hypothetical protein